MEAIRVAKSLLRVSLDLATGEVRDSDADWRILCRWIELHVEAIERGGRVPAAESFRLRRVLLAAVVNRWFGRAAGPRGVINLSEEGCLAVEQLPGGIGGALAYDFAQIIVRRDNRRRCSACNRLLTRNHQARNGIRRYCEGQKCKRAARADASRDYRSRRKLMGGSGRKKRT